MLHCVIGPVAAGSQVAATTHPARVHFSNQATHSIVFLEIQYADIDVSQLGQLHARCINNNSWLMSRMLFSTPKRVNSCTCLHPQ